MTASAYTRETANLQASDGYRLFYRLWQPRQPPRGCVVVLHGIQSHSGWYEYSAARLATAGYTVFFPDRRGSGQNGTNRGHTPHADRLVNDVVHFLNLARVRTAIVPALAGLSWGGKLAAAVAAQHSDLICSLSLLYPGLRPHVRPTAWQRLLLRMAAKTGRGHHRVPIPLQNAALFTNEPDGQRFIQQDALALHHVSVDFLRASMSLDQAVASDCHRITQPLLLMLAGRDRVIDNAATRELIRHFAASDRTIEEYADACHTLEFEPNREQIVDRWIEWLTIRFADSARTTPI